MLEIIRSAVVSRHADCTCAIARWGTGKITILPSRLHQQQCIKWDTEVLTFRKGWRVGSAEDPFPHFHESAPSGGYICGRKRSAHRNRYTSLLMSWKRRLLCGKVVDCRFGNS
jgi:hypothetical protein